MSYARVESLPDTGSGEMKVKSTPIKRGSHGGRNTNPIPMHQKSQRQIARNLSPKLGGE